MEAAVTWTQNADGSGPVPTPGLPGEEREAKGYNGDPHVRGGDHHSDVRLTGVLTAPASSPGCVDTPSVCTRTHVLADTCQCLKPHPFLSQLFKYRLHTCCVLQTRKATKQDGDTGGLW